MTKLRQYQTRLKNDIYAAWQSGEKNVLAVLPTRGGKTVVMGEIAREYDGYVLFVAHRGKLIEQISTQLAKEGIFHDLVLPKTSSLRKEIVRQHLNKTGKNYITNRCRFYVGSVDTLVNMENDPRLKLITLVITDEAHHVAKNKWETVFNYCSNARLLGFTATPRRADGKPLDVFDALVQGPSQRWLIDNGYLCDYEIHCPKTSDLNLDSVAISTTTGDYNAVQLKKAIHASSRLVGDVVKIYLEHAKGKRALTFAVDVEEAVRIAAMFNANGIAAEVLTGNTPENIRADIFKRYEQAKILQIISVDVLSEGVDVPWCEAIFMTRPTASLGLYMQQLGRGLGLFVDAKLMSSWDDLTADERKAHIAATIKPRLMIFDMVGNVMKHNLPDIERRWSLEGSVRRSTGDGGIPLRSCLKCFRVFERFHHKCPHCGEPVPLPTGGRDLEKVEGDLILLDVALLNEMRAKIERVDGDARVPQDLARYVQISIIAKHVNRQEAQKKLRDAIAIWAGRYPKDDDRMLHKRFYLTFGMSVLEAKALGTTAADELLNKIDNLSLT